MFSQLKKASDIGDDEDEGEESESEAENSEFVPEEDFDNNISLDNENVEKVFTSVKLDDKADDICQFYVKHNEMNSIKVNDRFILCVLF